MSTLREAAQQALAVLEFPTHYAPWTIDKVVVDLRAALAQPDDKAQPVVPDFDDFVDCDECNGVGFRAVEAARAIEREATAPLIEQIKSDEALMRDALEVLEDSHANHNAMCASTRSRLRQRLEANK